MSMPEHFVGDGCPTHRNDPDRITASEIARRLDVPLKNVYRWIERRYQTGFPAHLGSLRSRAGPIAWLYDWEEVEAWHRYWTTTRRGKNAEREGK